LPENRIYDTFQEMILAEKQLPADQRMDFVAIVTPNHLHFEPAKLALENGFHVVCDKPITFNLAQAFELKKLIAETGLLFALTHNYLGYPMVKQAKAMIKNGELGNIRKVVVEYPQGWLATKLEDTGQKQAGWRTDPARAGIANCMGDIGVHAFNLTEYVTGLEVTEMCADITSYGEGRALDDDGNVLLHFNNGAKGILHASQISVGEENNFNLRVYGEKMGLWWHQMEPNSLKVTYLDRPASIFRTGIGTLYPESTAHTRIPAGHPEAYIEAFANIYRNFAKTLQATLAGTTPDPIYLDFPGIEDGIRGMAFIETVIKAGKSNEKWVKLEV
ncbi:MAG: Gfo/Idh/MocA family oxidoreductase, partial [Verrucomicrobia bacterium]|nr:Gfo/Idh/MocA family oxidoreductase [Cytophagales bacterium]